jgi:hypothetical protein
MERPSELGGIHDSPLWGYSMIALRQARARALDGLHAQILPPRFPIARAIFHEIEGGVKFHRRLFRKNVSGRASATH